MDKKSVIAITGSNGFIAKHLIDVLQGDIYTLKRELLSDPIALQEYLQTIKPDYVYHLASYGNHYNQTDEDEIVGTNIMKTYLLLRSLKGLDLKGFINFSTSSVYGRKLDPFSEGDYLETDTFYGASKVASEYLCRAFLKYFPIINIRPFSVYGEGEADFRFIPTVIQKLKTGAVLDLDPAPVHDWIYIKDFLQGVFLAVENFKLLNGKSINIGNGIDYSNEEVVLKLEQISGKKTNINIVKGLRGFDTKYCWRADTKLLDSLGYRMQFPLERGLKETYAKS